MLGGMKASWAWLYQHQSVEFRIILILARCFGILLVRYRRSEFWGWWMLGGEVRLNISPSKEVSCWIYWDNGKENGNY